MDGNKCRHFLGLYPDTRPSCAVGRDVRKWATLCNGGSDFGIALRLPCTRQREGVSPLFDCPEVDRQTDAEVAARKLEMSECIDKFLSRLVQIQEIKAREIEARRPNPTHDCPWCGAPDALAVSIAIGGNNHMRCKCKECGEGFIE